MLTHTYIEEDLHNDSLNEAALSLLDSHQSPQYHIDFCSAMNTRRRRRELSIGRKEKPDRTIKPSQPCSMTSMSMIPFIAHSLIKAHLLHHSIVTAHSTHRLHLFLTTKNIIIINGSSSSSNKVATRDDLPRLIT